MKATSLRSVRRLILSRFPCVTVVDEHGTQYIKRWYLVKTKLISIYVHQIVNDDDADMHDHPWPFLILILKQGYREIYEHKTLPFIIKHTRRPLEIFGHLPSFKHRIELIDHKPSWSLVIMGPKVREWGFHTAQGWVHFMKYGKKGFKKGCE